MSLSQSTIILRPFFRDHPGEPMPAKSFFWTLWCYGGQQQADTPTIRVGVTPSGLIINSYPSIPHFYTRCPSCHNSPN